MNAAIDRVPVDRTSLGSNRKTAAFEPRLTLHGQRKFPSVCRRRTFVPWAAIV